MKKVLLALSFMVIVGLQALFAQTTNITGKVTDANDGMAIPGVSVFVKGTTVGTVTKPDGSYSITVPNDATTLVFSFVGMTSQEVEIAGQTTINVTMSSDTEDIDEVVVVAYGTKTKRAIVGAVTSVDAEIIENQVSPSALRALQGSSPGVNVITTGGQPGENPTVIIRGVGSTEFTQPLYVVDGMVFSGNINSISGDQIESMNVLKDASATALYGSRAANGVIVITTKKGKAKAANVSVNVRAGVSSPAVETYKMVGASDYMQYQWEAIRNGRLYGDGDTPADAAIYATNNLVTNLGYNPFNAADPVDNNGNIADGASLLWDTNWEDALIRDRAKYSEYSFSASGNTDKLSYFVSANHLDQEGAVIESDFARTSGRINLSADLASWLEIGTNNSFSKSSQNYPNQAGSGYTNTMQWIYTIANIYPLYQRDENGDLIYDDKGSLNYDYGDIGGRLNGSRPLLSGDNAVGSTYYHDIMYKRTSFLSSSYLNIKFTDYLSFRSSFGYENYLYDQDEYYHYNYGHAASVKGRVDQERNITETKTFLNALNFDKSFGDHSLGVNLISEVFDFNYSVLGAQGTGFLPGVKVLAGATTPEGVNGYINQERLVSYLGRATYAYKNKYFADFSYRSDASTRFNPDNRWGQFYAFGAGWVLSDEEFMSDLGFVSLAKIRGSYGELGNNKAVGYFDYIPSYGVGWNNNDNTGVLKGGYVDEDIQWEKGAQWNVALDYGFLNNRISGTIEYYNKESIDLLMEQPMAPSLGDDGFITNIGNVKNYGYEFLLETVNIDNGSFFWKTSFNIASNKNEILKLPQEEIISGTKKWRVGRGLYDFYIREYAGVDSETGEALWYMDTGSAPLLDENGAQMMDSQGNPMFEDQEKVTTNDYSQATRYYSGSSLPKVIGGFNSYMKYKGFDLNLLFNYSFGGKLYDYSYAGLMSAGDRAGQQWSADIENRWKEPGDVTDVPRLYGGQNDYNSTSTRFLFDNNFVRLKALTFGYQLPSNVVNQIGIQGVRVYLQADNIWTWQSHKGLDPEQNIAGTTDDRSNMMKTVSLGIKVDL